MEIAEIAGEKEGGDLASAVGQQFVARRPSLDHQVDMVRAVAFANEVAAGTHVARIFGERGESGPVVFGQRDDAFQLRDQRIERLMLPRGGGCGHGRRLGPFGAGVQGNRSMLGNG